MNKERALKMIVPVFILVAIIGIRAVKNKTVEPIPPPAPSGDAAELVQPNNDTDFLLEANAVDLEALTEYGLPLIIDFGSDSCIPCKEMAPVLQTINVEMQGKAIIKFVDVWKNKVQRKIFLFRSFRHRC